MYRYLHFCFIVVLLSLTGISLEIPQKIYGAPDWYSENCWFSNWKSPVREVDCATNVPAANYYNRKSVLGMRQADGDTLLTLIKQRGFIIAGVDYYALTPLSPFIFPKLFEKYSDKLIGGGVIYIKIFKNDNIFSYEILGTSRELTDR